MNKLKATINSVVTINCLINWERICTPKLNGGLGIIDIQVQNVTLLTK